MNKVNSGNARDILNQMSDEVIYNSTHDDSVLRDIFGCMSPQKKRGIIIGGLIRQANQQDWSEKWEQRERRSARKAYPEALPAEIEE